MHPLGSAALVTAYNERIKGSHDYDIDIDVLDMDEKVLYPAVLLDGQVNIQRDAEIRRTATLTLLDPDRNLGLDSASPFQGALFANKMIRIRHTIDVPGFGDVTVVPFVGTISTLNRNGATIDIECQDKTSLAILGNRPMTVNKGANAVDAIRYVMAQRCGETKFRTPANTRFRLLRSYSVGWDDEASPWAVCQRIARSVGLQMLYSCDGYLTLRPRQTGPVFEPVLTSPVVEDNDFSSIVNHARATYGKEVKTATPPSSHPFSPYNPSFMRNGIPRFMPSLADVDAPDKPDRPGSKKRKASKGQLKKFAIEMEKYDEQLKTAAEKAQATADSLLAAGLPMTDNLSCSAVPFYHLDVDDLVQLTTDQGGTFAPLSEASIPLLPVDMSFGVQRVLSRPGRSRR